MQSLASKIDAFQHKLVHKIHYNFDLKKQTSFLIDEVFKGEDEVMVAREIRLNYPLLEVLDGIFVRRRYPMEKESGVEETVYIERQGLKKKSEFKDAKLGEQFSEFGTILDIYVDEKQLYGFIRFQDKRSVQAVINRDFSHKFKIMTKTYWNDVMEKYYTKIQSERERISNLKVTLRGNYGKLEYKPNVIGFLQGLHKGTNSKIIKLLVEKIAPVAYVDYQMKQSSSYIRFKTETGAQIAASYFSRVSVKQTNGIDSVGIIGNADLCKKHYDLLRRGEPVSGITLQILDGEEESDYWSGIAQIQANLKSIGIDEDVVMEGTHVAFDDDGETLEFNTASKHVIFDDSDAEDEATIKVELKEKHKKKRHRSLK